ncbi:MAG: hypothetical protein C4575_03340, partial [Desulforudis sp.]
LAQRQSYRVSPQYSAPERALGSVSSSLPAQAFPQTSPLPVTPLLTGFFPLVRRQGFFQPIGAADMPGVLKKRPGQMLRPLTTGVLTLRVLTLIKNDLA